MAIFDIDKWQEIGNVLSKNKLRTLLTAFGVFWGIFMLLVLLGAGSGLQNGVTRNFNDLASNCMFLWAQKTTIPYKGFSQGRRYRLNNGDTKALRDNVPEIRFLAPQCNSGGHRGTSNVTRGIETAAFEVAGCVTDFFKIKALDVVQGRLINQDDINNNRKVVSIGIRVYETLFEKDENPIGEYVEIQGVYFMVVGVYKPKRMGGNDNEYDQKLFIPMSTFQKVYNWGDKIGWFSISFHDDANVEIAEQKVKNIIKERHIISPADNHAIGSWNTSREFKKISGLFIGIKSLIWFVGLGTLFAGVIGVSNIMLVVVKERTKEFGIKRALGATPISVIAQIIQESIIITSIAGIWGLVAGVIVVEFMNSFMQGKPNEMFANPEVDLQIAFSALIVLVVSGAMAGLLPAIRAVRVRPIVALRTD